MRSITTIAFDADDTLWHNERHFDTARLRLQALLADHGDGATVDATLHAAEVANLPLYGFGVKGFTLSMIETADRLTGGAVSFEPILAIGKEMLAYPIELLPGVEEALDALSGYRLLVITKGDLFDQERKLESSGLIDRFDGVHIVSRKDEATYRRIFDADAQGPARSMMVGNAPRSDIAPPLAIGAHAVHVPHDLSWDFEDAALPERHDRLHRIADLSELPGVVARLRKR